MQEEERSVRRRVSAAALTGVVTAISIALAGCSASAPPTQAAPTVTTAPSGGAGPPGPSGPSSPAPSSSAPSNSAPANPSVAACTSYVGAIQIPRQVVSTASTKPVLGPAVALVLVSFRGVASGVSLPADPALGATFTELVGAVDDLSNQLERGLPAGADATKTPVTVDPARLRSALDATDAQCMARGVVPKAG